MQNVFASDWDQSRERPGYRWHRMALGRRLGGELLGASVYELAPGQKSFPFHLHHANEELLLVLEGEVILRAADGEHPMVSGDAELFRRGPDGAHQVINRTEEPARIVIFSTMIEPEIAEYLDSGNIGVFAGRAPGSEAEATLWRYLDGTAERDYFAGEDEPES